MAIVAAIVISGAVAVARLIPKTQQQASVAEKTTANNLANKKESFAARTLISRLDSQAINQLQRTSTN